MPTRPYCLPMAEDSMASSRMPPLHTHTHPLLEAQLNEWLLPAGNSPVIKSNMLLPEENQSRWKGGRQSRWSPTGGLEGSDVTCKERGACEP